MRTTNHDHQRSADGLTPSSVTDEAILKIKDLVSTGAFGPGQKLPKEADLAAQLGLSRSSLREAVRALSLLGVLSVRQGDGTYVTTLEPGVLLGATGFAMDLLTEGSPLHTFQIRQLLEPATTALATARISRTDLARAEDEIDEMERATTLEGQAEADKAFHGIIFDSIENPALSAFLNSMSGLTLRIWTLSAGDKGEQLRGSVADHRAILRALAARDPEQARAAAAMHLVNAERWLRSAVRS